MSNFKIFAEAMRKRWEEMCIEEVLYKVDSDADFIWQWYLDAFPAGTNEIYRKRTEHDCACCRHFIRSTGNVVAIQNGALSTVWDLNGLPHHYQAVADAMSAYIKGLKIRDEFLTKERVHGQEVSRALVDNKVETWHHFALSIPQKFINQDPEPTRSITRTAHATLLRGLTELKPDAIATVLELMDQGAIYRGAEHRNYLSKFQELQARYLTTEMDKDLFIWQYVKSGLDRFRSSVIGTLVEDLSDEVDVEAAVRKYEAKVAPENYKRTTALISPKMIDGAMETLRELGLESAIARRHAQLADVSINSVLFVDRDVSGQMKDGVDSLKAALMQEAKLPEFNPKHATSITIDAFLSDVLPRARVIELYVEDCHLNNFLSVTAPVYKDAPPLFKWDNGFAWSYEGNLADSSIKERVKRAGGRVENVAMRVSLAWYNYDDLDLHCQHPHYGHVFFSNKKNILDVDMNAGRGITREAVENMRWVSTPVDGIYEFWVHNFCKRESIDVGFEIEIEGNGLSGIRNLRYEKAVPDGSRTNVARITVAGGEISAIAVASDILSTARSREWWGLKTLSLARVDSIILSPNYWDGRQVGNKHWFFILRDCLNPLPTRCIYNEFLRSELEPHRKVFEVLGAKTLCPYTDKQLSGVGFSSTKRAEAKVIVDGRPYTIQFGG